VPRYINIEFKDETERFTAELLDDAAPRTCEAVWNALPIARDDARHPMYSGLGVYTLVDFAFEEVENPHVLASGVGDVLFHANPNRSWVFDRRPHACEIYVPYGPLLVCDWAGETPLNKFGRIVDVDVEKLQAIGRRFRREGFQRMLIERAEGDGHGR
jgi:hypothetical protein